ncbi:hypothetical protein ACP3VW_18820 [Vibrio sp. DNB22_17_1]
MKYRISFIPSSLFVFLILLLSIMPMALSKVIVVFQLLLCISVLYLNDFKLTRLVVVILFVLFFLFSFNVKGYIDIKDVLLIFCILVSSSAIKLDKIIFESCLKRILFLIFVVCVLQAISPGIPNWSVLAENVGQQAIFSLGYASYSLLGNPTHTSYITLVIITVLFSINPKRVVLWGGVGLVILILAKNKICLLTYFMILSILSFKKMTGMYKVFSIMMFFLVSYLLWMLVFSKYAHWIDTDISKIHTISYRLEVFTFVRNWIFDNYHFMLGSSNGLGGISTPFDSGVLLLIFKYGVPLTVLIYSFLYYLCKGEHLLFFALAFPSITMVAFYNAQFMICIVLMLVLRNRYGKN